MKKQKLSSLADVRSGLIIARKESKLKSEFQYKLLTLKSINPSGYIDFEHLENYYATEKLKKAYISQIGDLIVRSSTPYTAVLIDESTQGLVISSYFTIIRIQSNQLMPSYLYWLLNNRETYKMILKNNFSNVLGSIKPSFFSELLIYIFPLHEQQKIAYLNLLSIKEQQLLEEIKRQKEKQTIITLQNYYSNLKGNIKNDN